MTMITVKTADLIGPALDWAVAVVEGYQPTLIPIGRAEYLVGVINANGEGQFDCFDCRYSTEWSQGGPLIERRTIGVDLEREGLWVATPPNWTTETIQYAETPLIAACRAIVASKLGDTVEIPPELIQ